MAVGLAAFCLLEGRRFFDGSSPSELGYSSVRSGQDSAIQRYREDRREIETILSDPKSLGGMYPGLLKESEIFPDPQEFKDIAINTRTLAFRLGIPIKEMPSDNEEYRLIYSDLMGWPHVQKPGEFRSLLVTQIQKERDAGTSEETKFAQDAEMAQRFSNCLKKIQEAREIARKEEISKKYRQAMEIEKSKALHAIAQVQADTEEYLQQKQNARNLARIADAMEKQASTAKQALLESSFHAPIPSSEPSSGSKHEYSITTLPNGQTISTTTWK